jgi:hypothetical protein
MIAHVLILWGVIAAASALAVVMHKRRTPDVDPQEFGSILDFVGIVYGVLLGLLLVFALGHYNDVKNEALKEATSLVSLYDAVGAYPPQTSDPVQHDLICYMRSVAADEWPSMQRGSQMEASRTLRFGDKVRVDVRTLPASDLPQQSTYGRAANLISDAGQSRQRLLFLTAPEIPAALWVVIYVGAFAVFSLLLVHYASRPAGRALVIGGAFVLLTVVVGVLAILDQPLGMGVRVGPAQMHHAVSLLLVGVKNPVILAPCS